MRKSGIILSLWTALLCFPLSSFALGLGEIEVSSYLNQPLKADIEVVAARPGEIDDLLVSLASRDAFRKAGLERDSDLSKLRFQIEKSEDGQSAKILVTTKSAIKEPFLNFLVEADWAKGRLLREYTILLDPPYFAQQPQTATKVTDEPLTPAPVAPVSEPQAMDSEPMQTESEMQPQPIALTEQQPSQIETQAPSSEYTPQTSYSAPASTPDEIVVTRGDTLWGIASRLRDDDHSMAQVMLAIQAMNPDAFGRNNINNLKVGAVIRTPDQSAYDDWTKQQAYAQVLEQNGLWDDYVARKTGAATAGSPMADNTAASEPVTTEETGKLSLLAPGDEESTTASMTTDSAESVNQVRKQLALAEEELEASRLENQDLKSRVSELEAQLKKVEELQKIVQITDNSLAQLQQQQSQQPTEQEMPATTAEESSGMVEEQPSEVMINAAEQMAAEEAAPADEMVTEAAPDQMSEGTTETMSESSEAETVLPTVPGSQQQSADVMDGMQQDEEMTTDEAVPAPAPVIVTETPDAGGIMDMVPTTDGLLNDPIVLSGIAAIVVLLLGMLFLRRRKSAESDEGITLEEGDGSLEDDDATPIHVPSEDDLAEPGQPEEDDALVETASMLADIDEEEDEFASTAVISAEDAQQTEAEQAAVEEDQDDVLNEVDVYLAYGLYDNAEDLLKENLENSPDRADYRAKLLDTYFATRNRDLFVKEAEALKSLGGAADRYWNRVQIMGYELAPDNVLFAGAQDSDLSVEDLEFAKPEAADFDIGADDEVTDYSNTDFDLGDDTQSFESIDTAELGLSDTELTDTQKIPPVLDDFSETKVDGEFDIPDLEAEQDELPDDIGDFDLDLGDSDEPDAGNLDLSAEETEAIDDEDALSFDLPDDLDLSTGVDELQEDAPMIELDDTLEAPDADQLPEMDADDIVLDLGSDDEIVELAAEAEVSLDEPSDFNNTDKFNVADINLDEVEDTLDEVEDDSQPMAVNAGDEETEQALSDDVEKTQHIDADLDLNISDIDSEELSSDDVAPLAEDAFTEEDDITEFRPAEMTGEFEIPMEEEVQDEVSLDEGIEKTGTFAPGDFDDDDLDADAFDDLDDISDLMLPDDVDEVGTKLDLAKAFIDMGDAEGARSSLEEVLAEGTEDQKAEATGLLQQIK